jgi:Asp-tRNA(Asn)/Glu-tRNA(Gln) amidotransferase A subunit family amidase
MIDLHKLSATDAARAIASGKITAVALAEACLARFAEREDAVQAWAHIDAGGFLAQARECDAGPRRGPLHGIPFGAKDVIDTADLPTEYGSPIYRGHRPAWDAACVALSRQQGGVLMGKTVTVEFACRHPNKTRNPHNPEHTPGGSSSGSAAAVADFMVPLALGTQTGGSMLRPASYCGTVGYKPSFNLVNRSGVKPVAESFDTVGIFARTVPDVALYAAALGASADSELSKPATALRIGFCRTNQWPQAQPALVLALENAASALGRKGASVREMELPADVHAAYSAHPVVNEYETSRALSYERIRFPEQISAGLMRKLDEGMRRSPGDYLAAREVLTRSRALLKDVFLEFDVLLTASSPGEAPRGFASTGESIFNRMWTALHVPCVSVPVFSGPAGLPMGAQVVGPFGQDARTLACAQWIMHALT